MAIDGLISYFASQHRSRTEAEIDAANEFSIDVEGLRKRRYRYRKRAGM